MSIIGSLISAGAGIVSNSISNAMARRNAIDQRKWQEDMWEKQKAYNSPGSQANLLRAAGLNPYDKVGFQPIGNAGTGATAETIPFENPVATFMNTRIQEAQLEGLELDNESKELDNARKKLDNDFASATFDQRVDMVGAQLEGLNFSNDQLRQITTLVQDAYFNSDGSVKNNPHSLDYDIKNLEKQTKDNELTLSNFTIELLKSQGLDYNALPADLKQKVARSFFVGLMSESDLYDSIRDWADTEAQTRKSNSLGAGDTATARYLGEKIGSLISMFGAEQLGSIIEYLFK